MSFIGKAVGKLTGADSAAKGAERAAQTQANSAQVGIDEQRRQFGAIQALLAPYTQAGTGALAGQLNLVGLNGAAAQQSAIAGVENSPLMAALLKQGENSILQNASATGSLRGGNVQAALSEFRPTLLAQLIESQFSKLGGLTSLGQNAAAMTGNAGMSTGANVASLMQQQGAALAGGQLARGSVARTGFNDFLKLAGTAASAASAAGGF